MQNNNAGLRNYFKELSKMPRDIELDGKVLLLCFARAFNCVKADRTIDMEALHVLANRWHSDMAAAIWRRPTSTRKSARRTAE